MRFIEAPASRTRAERGVTLIEVMVVVGIAAVLAALATPSLRGYYRRVGVSSAMRGLYAGFVEAQGLARSSGIQHQVVVDRSTQSWQIKSDINRDGTYETLVKTQTLSPDGVAFGPADGYGATFPAPYNTVPGTTWCSFCSGNSGHIEFKEDGSVDSTNFSSGSILVYDSLGLSTRIDALVFIAVTGDLRLFFR